MLLPLMVHASCHFSRHTTGCNLDGSRTVAGAFSECCAVIWTVERVNVVQGNARQSAVSYATAEDPTTGQQGQAQDLAKRMQGMLMAVDRPLLA